MHLCNFQVIRPTFTVPQEKALEWLIRAHTDAEARKNSWANNSPQCLEFQQRVKERFLKLGMGPSKIQSRASQLKDTTLDNYSEMDIFDLNRNPEGAGIKKRFDFFEKECVKLFEAFYAPGISLPEHLIHVTCTGYTAPSAAQILVSKRQAKNTTVTHAYHMGCYASIPAIKIAMGNSPADIVHTEFCTLHMNPLFHDMEQLIVQTLFADGFIRYSVDRNTPEKGLKILAIHEEILPDSIECMSWRFEEWGMRMTITKEVPVLIARSLKNFINILCQKAGCDFEKVLKEALFAIHPGGPKIVQNVGQILGLSDAQLWHSQEILRCCGNMSSATLPHVWESILRDQNVDKNTLILSLAFGPGLSIVGGLFQKCSS